MATYFMKQLLFLSTMILALASCRQYRYVYSASKINAPMLQEKNDSRINGSFSFGNGRGGTHGGDSSNNNGYDIQAAYAFTDHFAVMASVYKRSESDVFGNTSNMGEPYLVPFSFSYITYKRNFNEMGIGYYDRTGRDLVFSIYGGVARGKVKIRDTGLLKTSAYRREFSAQTLKYFLQPGITFRDNVDFSLRLSCLQHRNINTTYQDDELKILRMNNLRSSGQWFVEPSLTFQIPVQTWLKFETSMSAVFHEENRHMRFWNISTGITVNPSDAFRKKQQD